MDSLYRSNEEVREHARRSALGGREIWCNPHIGADAELWFEGWRSVPEAERGTRPDLLPRSKRRGTRRTRSMSEAGVTALGERTLPGSTPVLSHAARGRMGKRAFDHAAKAGIAEAEARTPKPWAIDGVGL